MKGREVMLRTRITGIIKTGLVLLAWTGILGIVLVDPGGSRAAGDALDPAQMTDAADALIRTGLRDHQVRTEALWLYEDVLKICTGDDPGSRSLKARAHLGLALIHSFDLFDLLPALANLLGLDLTNIFDLILGIIPLEEPSMASASAAQFQVAQACDPIEFRDYLQTLDELVSNMVGPIADHYAAARELDPGVTLVVENAWAEITPDDPATPEDESMIIDLSGEWDATDACFFQGLMDLILGGVKILTSYDGPFQNLVNTTMTPDCAPLPGSDEWTALFGPYGPLTEGGADRMLKAREHMMSGFYALRDGLDLMVLETDDQSDDVIRYRDVGSDGLGPDDVGYPGPDPDGTEGNGSYDLGEPWGMESLGELMNELLAGLLGDLPITIEDLSRLLPPPVLAGVMHSLGQSVENSSPVDLILTLIKPLLEALGIGGLTDEMLYSLGLPALNLGALFNPPLPDFSVMEPLKDADGIAYTEPETATGDTSHIWPDGSGRVDPPNGTVDAAYSFSQDLDEQGQPVGVLGGLLLLPITTPEDFDAEGNLIGEVDYQPMMNPEYMVLLTNLAGLGL
jgi:hypothetical protein